MFLSRAELQGSARACKCRMKCLRSPVGRGILLAIPAPSKLGRPLSPSNLYDLRWEHQEVRNSGELLECEYIDDACFCCPHLDSPKVCPASLSVPAGSVKGLPPGLSLALPWQSRVPASAALPFPWFLPPSDPGQAAKVRREGQEGHETDGAPRSKFSKNEAANITLGRLCSTPSTPQNLHSTHTLSPLG